MPCLPLTKRMSTGTLKRVGFVCGFHPVYLFRGYYFEVHLYHGPIPVRKFDHDPRRAIPTGFWDAWEAFDKLDKRFKEVFLIDEDNHYRLMDVVSRAMRKRVEAAPSPDAIEGGE